MWSLYRLNQSGWQRGFFSFSFVLCPFFEKWCNQFFSFHSSTMFSSSSSSFSGLLMIIIIVDRFIKNQDSVTRWRSIDRSHFIWCTDTDKEHETLMMSNRSSFKATVRPCYFNERTEPERRRTHRERERGVPLISLFQLNQASCCSPAAAHSFLCSITRGYYMCISDGWA